MNKQTKQLLNENNTLDKQLDESYTSVLTDIVVYIRSANISEYQQEVIRHDITQIMMTECTAVILPKISLARTIKSFATMYLANYPK